MTLKKSPINALWLIIFTMAILLYPLVSALKVDIPGTTITPNGTLSNDSYYLRGLSPQQVANLYSETDPVSIHTNAINTTQMVYTGGILSILESWLTSFGNNLWCRINFNCNLGNVTATRYNNLGITIWQTASTSNINLSVNCTEGVDCVSPPQVIYPDNNNWTGLNVFDNITANLYNGLRIDTWQTATTSNINFSVMCNATSCVSPGWVFMPDNYNWTGTNQFQNITVEYETINQNLTVNGNANIVKNLTANEIYGGMYYHNYTATTLNFASSSVYYQLFFTVADMLNGFGTQGISFGGNSNLTAQVGGVYQLTYFAIGDGINNHEYHCVPFINSTEQDKCESMAKLSTTGDKLVMSGTCLVRLSVGDKISLRIADYTGTGNGNYFGANINLVRVGN
jgi:hypothetical protein